MGRRAAKCYLQGKTQLWQSWIHRPCGSLNKKDPYKLIRSGIIRKYGPVGVEVVFLGGNVSLGMGRREWSEFIMYLLCIWLSKKKIQWKGCLYDWKKWITCVHYHCTISKNMISSQRNPSGCAPSQQSIPCLPCQTLAKAGYLDHPLPACSFINQKRKWKYWHE